MTELRLAFVGSIGLALSASGCCKPPTSTETTSSASGAPTTSPASTISASTAASVSPPNVKYTNAKGLKAIADQLKGIEGSSEKEKAKIKAVLDKAEAVMPVEIHPTSVAYLGDPLPLKDCEPLAIWGRVGCYLKVKVVAPNGFGKGVEANLACIDGDGASVVEGRERTAFDGKAKGDIVRAQFREARSCWEKGGERIVLRITAGVGNTRAPSQDNTNAEGDKDDRSTSGKTATFPEVVQTFIDMTEVQQKAYAKTFEGTMLSGSGQLFDVSKCGFTDDSKKFGRNCYKVTLDNGVPRVVLYFGSDDESKVAKYTKGNSYSFKNCKGISITNWGAWSTATCDTP